MAVRIHWAWIAVFCQKQTQQEEHQFLIVGCSCNSIGTWSACLKLSLASSSETFFYSSYCSFFQANWRRVKGVCSDILYALHLETEPCRQLSPVRTISTYTVLVPCQIWWECQERQATMNSVYVGFELLGENLVVTGVFDPLLGRLFYMQDTHTRVPFLVDTRSEGIVIPPHMRIANTYLINCA